MEKKNLFLTTQNKNQKQTTTKSIDLVSLINQFIKDL